MSTHDIMRRMTRQVALRDAEMRAPTEGIMVVRLAPDIDSGTGLSWQCVPYAECRSATADVRWVLPRGEVVSLV
jgi:hypothetical protein